MGGGWGGSCGRYGIELGEEGKGYIEKEGGRRRNVVVLLLSTLTHQQFVLCMALGRRIVRPGIPTLRGRGEGERRRGDLAVWDARVCVFRELWGRRGKGGGGGLVDASGQIVDVDPWWY